MGRSNKLSQVFLAIFDVILVNLGYALTFGLRFNFTWPKHNLDPYIALIPWLSAVAFIIFYMFDLYANWRRKSIFNLIYSIVLSILTLMLFTTAITFWGRGFAFPRTVIMLAPIVQVVLLSGFRSLVWLFARGFYGRRRVLIVAKDQQDGLAMTEKLMEHSSGWFVVQDFVKASDLATLSHKLNQVDVVLLSSNAENKLEIVSCCADAAKEVLVVPQLLELFILGSEPQQVDDMLVLSVQPPKLSAAQGLLKRLFDIVISLLSLIILSPVIMVLYLLVRVTSPGPALFKQERLGAQGKPYQILKFRSMVKDAEKLTGPVLATDKDPRITALGRFLRATRLDEIPQLINVLKGDMSLVGPRPERKFFIDKFEQEVPGYKYRMAVKPGITGLAQVMAKYSTTVEDKLRFDLMYVHNYSLAFDLKILFQTIRVVFQREQAAGVRTETSQIETLYQLFGNINTNGREQRSERIS